MFKRLCALSIDKWRHIREDPFKTEDTFKNNWELHQKKTFVLLVSYLYFEVAEGKKYRKARSVASSLKIKSRILNNVIGSFWNSVYL